MKKPKTIFDLIESEQNEFKKTFRSDSEFSNKEGGKSLGEFSDKGKESNSISSLNFFKDQKSYEDYFSEESDFDDRSTIGLKNNMIIGSNKYSCQEKDFIKISRLGNGSYGQVFKIQNKETNKIYALKEINKAKLAKENKLFHLIIENDMLQLCNHPNIIKYFGCYETKTNFSIIEEFCPFGDLSNFILKNKKQLEIEEIQYIIGQIIICLEYLSTKNIIHRDIKPENFLITDNFQLKLIDFGTSTFLGKVFDTDTNQFIDDNIKKYQKKSSDSFISSHPFNEEQQTTNTIYSSFKYKMTDFLKIFSSSPFEKSNGENKIEEIKRQKFVGTPEYMAPEIINSKNIGYFTDMWSVICILYLCFTGETPFSDKTEYLVFQKITNVKYNTNNNDINDVKALDLIKKFFIAEPTQRIGYDREKKIFDYNIIKSHPFFIIDDEKINLSKLRQNLMDKCSEYKKYLEQKNKRNNKDIKDHIENSFISEFSNSVFSKDVDKSDRIIKQGLLKKQSPYFYYDLRLIKLYDSPKIEYLEPEKSILKGTINLSKKCCAELLKRNQFKLVTPERTFVFMCKERYDISPWVMAINNTIEKYGS